MTRLIHHVPPICNHSRLNPLVLVGRILRKGFKAEIRVQQPYTLTLANIRDWATFSCPLLALKCWPVIAEVHKVPWNKAVLLKYTHEAACFLLLMKHQSCLSVPWPRHHPWGAVLGRAAPDTLSPGVTWSGQEGPPTLPSPSVPQCCSLSAQVCSDQSSAS